jgi:dihydrofolate reductase
MTVSMIAAMGANRAIGLRGRLPWRLPADLRFFKEKTWGHVVIMGRKTFESVGKPLPGRRNLVITRRKAFRSEGVEIAGSLREALDLAAGEKEVFVCGGAEIYRQALDRADRIYLTLIHENFEADTFFPEFDPRVWEERERVNHDPDERNPYAYSFVVYERRL